MIYPMYIDGEWYTKEGSLRDVVSPATGEVIGTVTPAGFEEVDRALKAADREKGNLEKMTVFERSEMLFRIADAIDAHKEELAKMIADEKDGVKMQITENQALFIFGNTHFYSRLLEGNYPETSRLIPESSDTRLEITASDLLASIERASLLSHESRNNVVKLSVNPENKIATVSGTSADVGNVEEEINADQIVGNPLEISFNPDYMRDALKSFGQTKILISFTTALRPFTLVPTEEKANFVQLITPVRTY